MFARFVSDWLRHATRRPIPLTAIRDSRITPSPAKKKIFCGQDWGLFARFGSELLRWAKVKIAQPDLRGDFIARREEETLLHRGGPDGSEFPHSSGSEFDVGR